VVFDCTVCSMFPDFPESIRAQIAELVLRRGVETQPLNTPPELQADFETFAQHVRRVQELIGDLHTLFHGVALHPDCPYGDNPLGGVHRLNAAGEELRERLAAEVAGTTLDAQISKTLTRGEG
jgi:hypothetical protein